jgi:hypothetical protein
MYCWYDVYFSEAKTVHEFTFEQTVYSFQICQYMQSDKEVHSIV